MKYHFPIGWAWREFIHPEGYSDETRLARVFLCANAKCGKAAGAEIPQVVRSEENAERID